MFKKIPSRKISDEIVNQFIDLIERGILKPGDQLPPEREMALELGISRLPLREALKALQAMGFINTQNRRKTFVQSMTKTSVQDPLRIVLENDIQRVFELLEIRQALESWAAARAAQKIDDAGIDTLSMITEKMKKDLANGDLGAKADADFHFAIAQATHNTILSHLMTTWYHLLWDCQKVSREKLFSKEKNRKALLNQHLGIFEAIKKRDAEKASRNARDHILFVIKELKNSCDPAGR
jgi:GntR family transcriptional repressor for pyruvate dehydrogenase complex